MGERSEGGAAFEQRKVFTHRLHGCSLCARHLLQIAISPYSLLTPLIPSTKVLLFVLFRFFTSPRASLTLTSALCYLGRDSSLSLKLQCLLHHTGWHNCQQLRVIEPLTCHTLSIALLLIESLLLFAFISFLPLDSLMSIFIASPWHVNFCLHAVQGRLLKSDATLMCLKWIWK